MALKRQQIFEQLQQLATAKLGSLVEISTYFTSANVSAKPSLVITPGNERVVQQRDDNRQLLRRIHLTACYRLQAVPDNLLNTLDPLCHLLENAWLKPGKQVLWQNLSHKGTDLSFTQDGQKVDAEAKLRFELEFTTETELVLPGVKLREIYLGYGGQDHELIARIASPQSG